MKSRKVLSLILTAVLLGMLTTSVMAAPAAFTDIAANPYKDEISYCQAKGYVNGVTPTLFSPDTTLTRGQFAAAWCRYQGFRLNHSFVDIASVIPRSYYDVPSNLLYSLGVMNGDSPTTFSPDTSITREQLAVIVKRALKLAATDPNAYKSYSDNAAISGWAAEAVSACLNNKVFRDLYAGTNLDPGKAVTRAEICKLMYNIDNPTHTITVEALTGGTVTPSVTTAHAGDPITLTITPDDGKQLKAGSLKYNGTAISGAAFTMPATDVIITAVFEDTPPSPSPSESPSPSPSEAPSPSPSESPSPSPSEAPSPSPSESPSPST